MKLKEFLRKWLLPTDESAISQFLSDLSSVEFKSEHYDWQPDFEDDDKKD